MHTQANFQAFEHLDIQEYHILASLEESKASHVRFKYNMLGTKNIDAKIKMLEAFSHIEILISFHGKKKPELVFEHLSKIKNLKKLTIKRAKNEDFTHLQKLKNLEYLSLQKCTEPFSTDTIQKLKLKGISVEECMHTKLDSILAIDSLEEIILYGMKLTDAFWERIEQLQNLKAITIKNAKNEYSIPTSFQQLKQLEYIVLHNIKVKEVPSYFTQYQNLYCLDFGKNQNIDWDQYFETLAQFPKLKKLDLNANSLNACSPKIALMTQVTILDISNVDVKTLPKTLRELKGIKQVIFKNNPRLKEIFELIASLPLVKEVIIEQKEIVEVPEEIGLMQQVESIEFNDCYSITDIPEAFGKLQSLQQLKIKFCSKLKTFKNNFKDLKALTTLKIVNCYGFDMKDLFENSINPSLIQDLCTDDYIFDKATPLLAQMTNLKNLTLYNRATNGWGNNFENIANIQSLETLTLIANRGCTILPSFVELGFLKKINLNTDTWFSKEVFKHLCFPIGISTFKDVILESNNPHVFKNIHEYFSTYAHTTISSEKKHLAFAMLNDIHENISEIIDNKLLSPSFKADKTKFFILGKIEGFTKKEIRNKLKDYGFSLAKTITQTVDYVVLGNNCEPDAVKDIILNQDLSIITGDHLKAYFWEKDNPYLMEKNTEDMNEQVINLLVSNDIENIQLAFEILKAGGVSGEIMSYLAALYFFHEEKEIKKGTEKLIKLYGSDSLQKHIKANLITSNRYAYYGSENEEFIIAVSNHPELDSNILFVFALIIKKETVLSLKESKFRELPEQIKYHNQLESIEFYNADDYDIESSLSKLKSLPNLKKLSINNLSSIPNTLFDLKELKELSLVGEISFIPDNLSELTKLNHLKIQGSAYTMPKQFHKLNQLNTLELSGENDFLLSDITKLKNLEKLVLNKMSISALPESIIELKKLKYLSCTNCHISSIEVLTQLPTLEYIDCYKNNIKEIPSGFTKFDCLKIMRLKNNAIEKIAEDFVKLSNIEECDLAYNQIKEIPSIENWSKLTRMNFAYNQINNLPKGIDLCKALEKMIFSNNMIKEITANITKIKNLNYIAMNNNQIKEIPVFLKNCKNLKALSLNNNQIEKFMDEFEAFANLTELYLKNNKIKSLPTKIPKNFQLGEGSSRVFMNDNPISRHAIEKGREIFYKIFF